MAIESTKVRLAATLLDGRSKEELAILLANLILGLQAVMTKLDADAGVTDTNYGATFATYITN